MSNDIVSFSTPAQVCDATIASNIAKSKLPLMKMIILAMLAGAFIALGASASSVAIHDISNVGIARLIAGVIFPAGLMMIVMAGGELFTGNSLMVQALLSHEIGLVALLRNWVVVYIGNLIGSLIIVGIVYLSGELNYTAGALGALTIKIAVGKVGLPFFTAFCSAILCNVLVCIAVLMATAAKDVAGKILAILFPIMAFVLSGFEHCVANMYYIPAGMLAALNPTYAAKATELYGIGAEKLATLDLSGLFANLVPVTLGNIVGGLLIGTAMYAIHKSKTCNPSIG
ncbi:MAG: formate/nitrite transporter family protein [Actinobacteria bacterium]|nr:formate/nitrite transporter family protein [Actinomycetota bacterium]